jgi:hypothetical protein
MIYLGIAVSPLHAYGVHFNSAFTSLMWYNILNHMLYFSEVVLQKVLIEWGSFDCIQGPEGPFVNVVMNLTFVGPCIIIYFYSKTNKMHNISKFILFWNNTLHVSDSLSIHHQESVHTASGICTVLDS